jgi:hypothetical protein
MRWLWLLPIVLSSFNGVAMAQQDPATPVVPDPAGGPGSGSRSSVLNDGSGYPKPSPYPISWELEFMHGSPKRVVVEVPGGAPRAYWYMTYTVMNNTDQERVFLPVFEMLTDDGRVIRSDKNIPYRVFEVIKSREGNRFLEHFTQLGGEIRLGEDQAKEGVAIWEEPMPEMGHFSIFVGNLSGEIVIMKDASGKPLKDPDGRPIILRKTKQLNYFVRGDEVLPGEDAVNEAAEQWVMR